MAQARETRSEKKAAEEAAKAAEEAAKAAEIKAREEARAKAREELENQEQTIDLEAQREAMKQFEGGDGWYDGQHRHRQAQVGERHIFPRRRLASKHTLQTNTGVRRSRVSPKKRRHLRTTNNTSAQRQRKHNKSTISTHTAPREGEHDDEGDGRRTTLR